MGDSDKNQNSALALIVDDQNFIRQFLRRVFESDGYEVAEAEDGVAALSVFLNKKPDIVLMDIVMPVMDGLEALSRLRLLPGGKNTPVIITTSIKDSQSVEKAFEVGADDFIVKPINPNELLYRVSRLLKARETAILLDRSEAYAQSIINLALDGIATTGSDKSLKTLNPAAERIFGYSFSEVIGHNVGKLIPELNRYLDDFTKDLSVESFGLHKNGYRFPLEVSIIRFLEDEWLFTVRDITNKRKAEERLNKRIANEKMLSEISFRSLYENSDEISCLCSQDGHDINKHRKIYDELQKAYKQFKHLLASVPSILIGVDTDGLITVWNSAAEKNFNILSSDVVGRPFFECGIQWDWSKVSKFIAEFIHRNYPASIDNVWFARPDEKDGLLVLTITLVESDSNGQIGYLLLGTDITDRKKLETQLSLSQKLESIGQLAAGIAHEINTPMQYIGDNMRFLQDAFKDICSYLVSINDLLLSLEKGTASPDSLLEIKSRRRELDIDFLTGESPAAIDQSLEGIERVRKIVLAMKDFSHPGIKEKMFSDINKAIEGTVTISRNEWKYISELETDLEEKLPLVYCTISEINQVILNMIVNAAQAVSEKTEKPPGVKGKIFIKTRSAGDFVKIMVGDNGTGIPESIIKRVFDPFFTTKDVSVGTGQGLAIAHDIIVNKHKGAIDIESELGKGTTFTVTLPVGGS
jgi:PAS domain S-box-containing protein